MSRLRARCPRCRTLTSVALGDGYECHACGAVYAAGLVRVPAAWGSGGERMAEAARAPLPFPEVAVVEAPTLAEQNRALAEALPTRPLVLGGCCCAHVGAVEGLAAREGRLALVWIDAHGDLNTPETSPSGDEWGMPLRMLLDAGRVRVEDAALVGARELGPGEETFIAESGLALGQAAIDVALAGADRVYVALDCDVLDPSEPLEVLFPARNGLSLSDLEALLRDVAARLPLAGAGLTGLVAADANGPALERLCAALGLR